MMSEDPTPQLPPDTSPIGRLASAINGLTSALISYRPLIMTILRDAALVGSLAASGWAAFKSGKSVEIGDQTKNIVTGAVVKQDAVVEGTHALVENQIGNVPAAKVLAAATQPTEVK